MKLNKFFQNHWFALLTGAVLLLALALRLVGLGKVPVGLYWDEIAMLVDAQAIAATGKDFHGLPGLSLILPSYGDYKLPVYVWLSVPMMFLPLAPELQIRLISALAGFLTVIVAGLLAAELFVTRPKKERQILFLATLFIGAILPWSLAFSHAAFEGHLGQFWVALSAYLILKARSRPWLLIPAGVLGAVGLSTYYSVRFVWPVVALTTWLYGIHTTTFTNGSWKLASKHRWIQRWVLYGATMLLVFILGWFTMTKAPWYPESQRFRLSSDSILKEEQYVLDQNVYREITGNTRVSRLVFHRYGLQLGDFLQNFFAHLDPEYLFISGDTNLRHGTGYHGLAYLAMAPLLIAGCIFLLKWNPAALVLLLVWWAVALVPASIPTNTPHALRSLNALVPLAVLIGIGLGALALSRLPYKRVIVGVTLSVLLLSLTQFTYYYLRIYPTVSANFWQDGYASVARSIRTQLPTVDRAYVDIGDGLFFLWYFVYSVQDPKIYHQAKSKEFIVKSFGEQTVFTLNDFPSDLVPGQTYLLAGQAERVAELLSKLSDSVSLSFDQTITAQNGAQSYRVVTIQP